MKSKQTLVCVLLLFLGSTIFIACETPEDETNEIENKQGVDKSIDRPGEQGN